MGQPTLEQKSMTDERAARILREALESRGGKLTRSDAVAVSGLPAPKAEVALQQLARQYRSHLAATESGELIYDFGATLERRDAVSLRERLEPVFAALWKGFKFLFKIAIVGTLIFYFVAFVAMILALIFARSAGDRDDRDDRGGGFVLHPLFWFWGWGPHHDPYARRTRSKPRKPLYKAVFDYVFGPSEPPRDALGDEKIILAYLRERGGRVTASDLVALMGWDYARAEEEVTRLLIDYGGEAEVTDDGAILYVFKDLRRTAGALDAASRPSMAWERPLPDRPLTGNTPGTDTAITLLNGFNLSAPFWVLPLFAAKFRIDPAALDFTFLQFPIWFSSLFFAVPGVRWIKERRRRKRARAWNARLRVLREIWRSGGAPRTPEQLAPDPEARAQLEKLLGPLEADVTVGEGGRTTLYSFPRLVEEQKAAGAARITAGADEKDAGAVLFSSGD